VPILVGALRGKLLLVAGGPFLGSELWVSDGTTGGTTLLKDISSGGRILLAAQHRTKGMELFGFDPGANGKTVGSSCSSTRFRLPTLEVSDPIPGGILSLEGSNAKTGALGLPLLGSPVQGQSLPLPFLGTGCVSYINLFLFWLTLPGFQVPGGGTWTQNYGIPNQTSLQGVQITFQVAFFLPGTKIWEMTNGYATTIGR
jgi:ELWxxDGT repeat protein